MLPASVSRVRSAAAVAVCAGRRPGWPCARPVCAVSPRTVQPHTAHADVASAPEPSQPGPGRVAGRLGARLPCIPGTHVAAFELRLALQTRGSGLDFGRAACVWRMRTSGM